MGQQVMMKRKMFSFYCSSRTANFMKHFIELNDIDNKGAGFLKLMWENTMVKIAIKSKADENILALIEKCQ
jgi:hypothetical protein